MARWQVSELIGGHSLDAGQGRLFDGVESLENRALLATNVTVTNSNTSGGTYVGGVFTPTAGAPVANVDRDSIEADLDAGISVVINTASTGASAGTLTITDNIVKAAGGNATLTFNVVDLFTLDDNRITANAGQLGVVINAGNGVTLSNGSTDITTNGGALTIGAGLGAFTSNHSGQAIATAGGEVSITASDIALVGTIDASAGNISFLNSFPATTIGIGGAAGTFNLSDAELTTRINSTGTVTIGNTSSGAISIGTVTNLELEGFHLTIQGGAATFSTGLTLPSDMTLTLNTGAISSGTGTDVTIAGAGTLSITSSGAIGDSGNSLEMSVANLTTNSSSGGNDQFLSTSGSVSVAAGGINAGTGTIELVSGTFQLSAPELIGDESNVTVTSPAVLDLNGNPETFDGLAGTGTLNSAMADAELTVGFNGGTATFSGVIEDGAGSVSLAMSGAGTQTLSGTNTYTGTTSTNAGTLLVNGSILDGTATIDMTVDLGGTLGGTGTVSGAVQVNDGGTVAPGTSPGILNSGSVDFTSGSTFAVEIGGTSPGNAATDHDQLNVTGSVTISDTATLSVSSFGGFVPSAGDHFVIISNDTDGSGDAVNLGVDMAGFNGLTEGDIFSSDFLGSGLTATITYVGGDGNDVGLVVNYDPTAQDVTVEAIEDGAPVTMGFDAADVDSDDDPTSLTYDITSVLGAGQGSVTNNGDGTFTFYPGTDFQDLAKGETRVVSFTYIATDLHAAESNVATVTITVTGVGGRVQVSVNASRILTLVDVVGAADDIRITRNSTGTHFLIRTTSKDLSLNGGPLTNSVQILTSTVSALSATLSAGDDKLDLSAISLRTTVLGGDGNDSITGSIGDDRFFGGVGNDTLNGCAGFDKILGGDGNDLIYGGTGNDVVDGEAGDDRILGQAGNDALRGGTGNDTIEGGTGNDTMLGGAGNDSLTGDDGADLILGEAGADTIVGGLGTDRLAGGGNGIARDPADTISGMLSEINETFSFMTFDALLV